MAHLDQLAHAGEAEALVKHRNSVARHTYHVPAVRQVMPNTRALRRAERQAVDDGGQDGEVCHRCLAITASAAVLAAP